MFMVKGKWGREKGFKQKEETKRKISEKVKAAYKKWKAEEEERKRLEKQACKELVGGE